jgi:SSS family solute:Na+ symporter
MQLHLIDYAIIVAYFAVMVGVGWILRRRMRTGLDFFLAGRSLPAWITGLAFISANLGSLEVMGHAANAAKYGMMAASCFYWIGAIPAMVFLGVFMMPFYYGNQVKSSPEYLALRFDERVRGFNAIAFAVLTVLMSGINMYAMALVFKIFLGWPMDLSIWASAAAVILYVGFGGLTSAIYNEVLQFLLIVAGMLPLSVMALRELGGFSGLFHRLPYEYAHAVAIYADPARNPMGVPLWGVLLGLSIFGGTSYWCTDFLVVQRALAARDMLAAQRTPLIAAFFKMLFPLLIILPGLAAPLLEPARIAGRYNLAIPVLLQRYYPAGLMGLGLTALLASFMSGMAGNVTAFNTVWTYDIYKVHIRPGRPDLEYVRMGRIATVVGTLLSIATSYIVARFENMGDYLLLVFSLFIFPMSTVFLLGMFWKRATASGAFLGMIAGVAANGIHYLLYRGGVVQYRTEMAANIFIIIAGWLAAFLVTVVVSYATPPKPEAELAGLVYAPQAVPGERSTLSWYKTPAFAGALLMVMLTALLIVFW